MDPGAVWILNLDAEEELAARGGYTPSRAMAAVVAAQLPRARAVLPAGDDLLDDLLARGERADGRRGSAWCPTPTALARLRAVGAVPDPAPPLDVLRRVNGRSFLHVLGGDLPGARSARSPDEVTALPAGRMLLLQREHGASGRGARSVCAGELTEADELWIAASLRRGPLLVRPRVDVLSEQVVHGWIERDGGFRIGVPCVQVCDARGQWVDTRRAPESLDTTAARGVAAALVDAGYFGPFGLDSLRYRDADGGEGLAPCTDLNARYTMGWRVGMEGPERGAGTTGG